MRVLTRLLVSARKQLRTEAVPFRDHRRAANRRSLEIQTVRGAEKRAPTPWAQAWAEDIAIYIDLLARVVDQTKRRVFKGEKVPAAEKVVSLFEPHTDIIVKGGRKTYYGHKVNFAIGCGGLVMDAVVEDGNPADSARCLPMLRRHVEHYGAPPSRVAFDGGYASKANLTATKEMGVEHVVFNKKCGLKVADMTPSSWIYTRLKRFRAGVEAGISYLKLCFELDRCLWRGLSRFKAYLQSAVFAHNLMRLIRLLPKPTCAPPSRRQPTGRAFRQASYALLACHPLDLSLNTSENRASLPNTGKLRRPARSFKV